MHSLVELYDEILARQLAPKEGSYTTYLFSKGLDKILKKVGEEATEVVIAAKNHDKQELIAETADLFYHTLVLLAEEGVSLTEIEAELESRQGKISQTKDRATITDLQKGSTYEIKRKKKDNFTKVDALHEFFLYDKEYTNDISSGNFDDFYSFKTDSYYNENYCVFLQ